MERAKLKQVLQALDSRGSWSDAQLDALLKQSGAVTESGSVRYESFIRWVGASAASPTATANACCQAAFQGEVAKLRAFVEANGQEKLCAEAGFVEHDGSVVAISIVERGVCQLRKLSEAPSLHPANALHYAAFAGKAEAVKYLIEIGLSGTDDGHFYESPKEVFLSHRLMLDGSHVEDEEATAAFLGEHEEPLCAMTLSRTISSAKK